MPELPEVHTITIDLNTHITGYKITKAEITSGYRAQPHNEFFIENLLNQEIIRVKRKAKNILIELANGKTILFHLAMTGQILLKSPTQQQPRWTRVKFELEKETNKKVLYFTDMRMFGKAAVLTSEDAEKLDAKYGPEPISDVSVSEFHKLVISKRTTIKNLLLDQAIISGLGNIYATDALFMAEIHPETQSHTLTTDQAQKLLESSREILLEGIEHRGSTLSDRMYVDIFGKEGSHQKHFKIYGKETCPKCSSKVEFKKIAGRGTYFCPTCQPKDGQKGLFDESK